MKSFSKLIFVLLAMTATIAEAKRRPESGSTSELCPNGEHARRMRLTNYYTPVVTAKCSEGRIGLLNYIEKEHKGSPCSPSTVEFVLKTMEGAGTVLGSSGQHLGVLVSPAGPLREILASGYTFSEVPPVGTPSGMVHVAEPVCPLGFGHKTIGYAVCLEPFKSVACPPHHALGEVVFIPAAVGIKYPRYPGELKADYSRREGHDGYFYCGDIGQAIQGEHIDLFSGFINPYSSTNPFTKFGSTRDVGVCWAPQDSSQDADHRYRYHTASDINPWFPGASLWTHANYTNEYLLSRAYALGFWSQSEDQ